MISHDLWHVPIPLLEKVIRTVAVYAGIAILLRVGGKREVAQLNTFDLVVMLLLSNVVQNAIIGSDNSLPGGLLGAAVLVAINALWVRAVNRHARLARLVEGNPTVLIEHGQPDMPMIRRLGLRFADVAVAIRRQGANDISEVDRAVLAPSGTIVVDLDKDDQDVTRRDLERFREQLRDDLRQELRAALGDRE